MYLWGPSLNRLLQRHCTVWGGLMGHRETGWVIYMWKSKQVRASCWILQAFVRWQKVRDRSVHSVFVIRANTLSRKQICHLPVLYLVMQYHTIYSLHIRMISERSANTDWSNEDILSCTNISQYYCYCIMFYKCNLVSIRDYFLNIFFKYLTDPKL